MTVPNAVNFVAFNRLQNNNPIASRRRKLIARLMDKPNLLLTKKVAFPQISRHFSYCGLMLPLELMGTELIEMLMAPNTIVETLDVIEDF